MHGKRRLRPAMGVRLVAIGVALAALLAGCYVAPAPVGPGPRWCYYHPFRC